MLFANSSFAVTCASWKDADKSIRSWWSKAYPNEKILSVEQNGAPDTYDKAKATGQTKVDEYGNTWEYNEKATYCRVPAKVMVQQSSGKRNFSVSAIYHVGGKKYVFDDLGVGNSEAVPEPGQAAAPDKDEIKKVITEKVLSCMPPDLRANIQVAKVMITPKREYQTWENGQSGYYMDSVDLFLVVDGESKPKCEIAPLYLYKGEENNMRLEADGPWKIKFRVNGVPSNCVGNKYGSKVSNYTNHTEEPQPKKAASDRKKTVSTPQSAAEPETIRDSGGNGQQPSVPNVKKKLGF
jgi:hypothetical protein